MDHKTLSVIDQAAIIGELEHIRRHAIRSAHSTDNDDDEFTYLVIAKEAQTARRRFQEEHLPTSSLDWCLVKAACTLKQLAYETMEEDVETLDYLEQLADKILSTATGKDLSGCEACKEDMEAVDE